ncbi:protein TolQ [Legionella sp. W05-934-2]|uniref:protein TolQ n=1 Tax=Legionella sp. W05-934-2 TaxID=1198649 RepID=UPI003462DEA1
MLGNISFLSYFAQADIVVKSVMLGLILASLFSWALILYRSAFIYAKQQDDKKFMKAFETSTDLGRLYASVDKEDTSGLASIFKRGFKEFLRYHRAGKTTLEPIERVMQISALKEENELTAHHTILASVGAIAPFVGLFGTVWGIMNAFHALGQVRQATIAMVAPGLSEALFATALGLFAAIPAVIAYNRLQQKSQQIVFEHQLFQEELLLIFERQTLADSRDDVNETNKAI